VVFGAARAVEGPVELVFNEWDVDQFGKRELIPYHVKLILKAFLIMFGPGRLLA
jgi:hypothetical protein